MKGQNLAVETVFTVGLGIALATGIVTVFNQYQSDISLDATNKQAQIASSRVQAAIYSMEAVDKGKKTVSLPDEMGSAEYTIEVGENVKVISRNEEYNYPLNGVNRRFSVSGSAPGGDVKVYKSGNEIRLLEN